MSNKVSSCRSVFVSLFLRIPTSQQIFEGHQAKVISFVFELFHTYVSKPWGGWKGVRTTDMLTWFGSVLCQYSTPFTHSQQHRVSYTGGERGRGPSRLDPWSGLESRISDSPHEHFRSGTDLFCILYHFYGPCMVSDGTNELLIDPSRVFFSPTSLPDMRSNVSYVFDLLEILGVDVFWTVDEWINVEETTFKILQLSKVHELCRERQCVVPLADTLTLTPGITSGPFGRPLIVGLRFIDTPAPPPPLPPPMPPLTRSHEVLCTKCLFFSLLSPSVFAPLLFRHFFSPLLFSSLLLIHFFSYLF